MSIARALSNAVSGLAATSRGTETVAANIANVMTPGYARREVAVSSQVLGGSSGGVRIDGVSRVVNAALLAETRLSNAAHSQSKTLAAFFNTAQDATGLPGEVGSISTALTDFEAALIAASARPDEALRLENVAEAASTVARRLNSASDAVQNARTAADASIANQVATLQQGLDQIASLNRQIAALGSEGEAALSLHDERQAVIDRIGEIVPLQVIPRDAGRVSVFTAEGAMLLDGLTPARLSFVPAGAFTADMQVGNSGVGGLIFNGDELVGAGLRLFQGGSLGAAFAVRDTHAPELQAELDALAQDIYQRFADPAVDMTLAPGDVGLFTDNAGALTPPPAPGLAGRIAVNAAVLPDQGGELWRLRSGLNATAPGPAGDGALINRLSDALTSVRSMSSSAEFDGRHSAAGFLAQFEARVASRRLSSESDMAVHAARSSSLSERLMADGVDTDFEMQRLLQYEQAYAANARVIQAIDEMMNTILRV